VVVTTIAALLNLRFTGKSLYEILLGRTKIIVFSLALLVLLMPAVFSLLKGTWLSPRELGGYTRELLVSVVTVVSFSVTWKVLREVSLRNVEKMQIRSLAKWIDEGDITGWYELMERVRSGDELCPGVRSVVEWKLWQVQKGFNTEPRHIRDDDYQKRLEALLYPQPMVSIYSDVEEMQVFSLAKWIDEGDITGWLELKEDVYFGDGLRPGVRSMVEWLLQVRTSRVKRYPVHTLARSVVEWSLQVWKGFRTEPRQIRRDDERRLKLLLSFQP
jgi:hypothetical protein